MRVRGIPVTSLQEAVLFEALNSPASAEPSRLKQDDADGAGSDQVLALAIRDLGSALGPAVEPPRLVDAGFELVGSRPLRLLGVDAVRLDYRSVDSGLPAVIFELADPLAFVHLDIRGRQIPLLPGTRIEESVFHDSTGGAVSIGLVMLGFDGRATVIVVPDPDVAPEIADLIEPTEPGESESVIEGVATILVRGVQPMTPT
jgi:hypothetical protein